MGQSIVQIRQMGDALRSSGYKSIDSAVAELIDNSIEAGAHDVFVIMREHIDPETHTKGITTPKTYSLVRNAASMTAANPIPDIVLFTKLFISMY